MRAEKLPRGAQREHLAAIVDSAIDAIITVDDEQRIIMFTTAAEQVFGCRAREVIGNLREKALATRPRPLSARRA